VRIRDQGQAALLFVVVCTALFVASVMALSVFGSHVVDRTRAQSAADAAALGSLDGDRAVAAALAERHGGVLVDWSQGPGPFEVTVVVRVGDVTATARASDSP
jgi:hypothetical protein